MKCIGHSTKGFISRGQRLLHFSGFWCSERLLIRRVAGTFWINSARRNISGDRVDIEHRGPSAGKSFSWEASCHIFFGSGTVCRWMEGADAPRCKSRINLANPIWATARSGLPLTPIAALEGSDIGVSADVDAKARMRRGQESLLSLWTPRFPRDYDTVYGSPAGIVFPRRLAHGIPVAPPVIVI